MSNENLGETGTLQPDVTAVKTAEAKTLPWYRKLAIGFGIAAVAGTTAVDAHAYSPITQENAGGHTITMTRPNDGPPKPIQEPTLTPESPLEIVSSRTDVSGHDVDTSTTVTQVSPPAEPFNPEPSSTPEPVSPIESASLDETVDPIAAMEAAQQTKMEERATEILAKLPVTKEVRNDNGVMVTVLTVTKDGLQTLQLTDCTKVIITRAGQTIMEREISEAQTEIDVTDTVQIGDVITITGDSNGNGSVGFQAHTMPGQ